MATGGKVGILVGGGPAPGINSVIGAATIRCVLDGMEVVGIRDGFEWVMRGDISKVVSLTTENVSRVHFRGGSVIGISRANPSIEPDGIRKTLESLRRLEIDKLIVIGGDGTATQSRKLGKAARGAVRIVHVPKTIDNDIDLPAHVDTFGFQTARHIGVEVVKNLMVDAYTTSRWYIVVTMGRKAGHLALGMGKAAGATLSLIPEEFGGKRVRMRVIIDTLACAIIKRLHQGRLDGVAVIAEGVLLALHPADLALLGQLQRDQYGNVSLREFDTADLLKQAVIRRLKEFGVSSIIVPKSIGFELRCADPIPADMEYTRDLGYCAAKYLLDGGSDVMVSMQAGQFVPVPLDNVIDKRTGRAAMRVVDIHSARYAIARRYMIRLRRDDFEDPKAIAGMAAIAHMSPAQFTRHFKYLVRAEPPPLQLVSRA